MDDWFLGSERDAQPCSAPVPFFWEVKLILITKSWKAPFSAWSRFAGSSDLTTLDGGAVWGYPEVPQVKCTIAVHLCPQNAATWRNRLRLPSKACTVSLPHRSRRGLTMPLTRRSPPCHPVSLPGQNIKDLQEGIPDLAEMRDAEKVSFLDTPISQCGLFSDTVKEFAQQFLAVKKQTEAIKQILPWCGSASRKVRPPKSQSPLARQ